MRVTPKYVNPPKEGQRSGSIKTADGQYFYFDPKVFSFTAGQSYDLDIKEQTGNNGKVYAHVIKINPGGAGSGPAASDGGSAPWFMPFVSNTVANAISVSRIEAPSDILAWARAARDAALLLTEKDDGPDGGPDDFDPR